MNAIINKNIFKKNTINIVSFAHAYLCKQSREMMQAAQSPIGLAGAFALGTLTSFLPVPLLDSLLAVGLALKFERLNKAAIFLARAIWNDLLVVPLYAPGFKVGQFLLGAVISPEAAGDRYHPQIVWLASFLLGAAVLATIAAFLGFVIVLCIAKSFNHGEQVHSYSPAPSNS